MKKNKNGKPREKNDTSRVVRVTMMMAVVVVILNGLKKLSPERHYDAARRRWRVSSYRRALYATTERVGRAGGWLRVQPRRDE